MLILLVIASQAGDARPQEAVAAFKQGRWLLETQRPLDAVRAFDRAIAIDPSFADAWFQRGTAWYQRGQQDRLAGLRVSPADCARAQADFTRALELGARRADVFHARGLVHADSLDFWRALRDFDEALRCTGAGSEPPDAQARRRVFLHNDRGNAWAELRRYREAIRDYSLAIRFNKQRLQADRADATWYNAQILRNRARAYTALGHRIEARQDLREAAGAEVAGPRLHRR